MALAFAMCRAAAAAAGPGGSVASLQGARGWLVSMFLQSADSRNPAVVPASCRTQHIIAERQPSSVVPADILRELKEIEASLSSASRLDGRRRASLPLSAAALPFPLPPHSLESGLPSLDAHVRSPQAIGATACKWLRKSGRVPGRVHSLPGQGREENLMLHFDEVEVGKMVRSLGRNGCTARVLQLNLVRPQQQQPPGEEAPTSSSSGVEALGVLRVKPVRVHMNAVTQRLEGLDLIFCPADREVVVDVPVKLVNDDLAPGARKGGWMNMLKRTVRYKALGNSIPPYIELNVRHLDLDQDLLVREMPIPPGTKLYEKNYNALVVRCTTDMGGKD